LSITDFIKNTSGYYFATDIIAGNGATGNVASSGPPTSINPLLGDASETASIAILGVGLPGLGFVASRKRSV
jgi:hypothetical protein